jgi:hypothetical protein
VRLKQAIYIAFCDSIRQNGYEKIFGFKLHKLLLLLSVIVVDVERKKLGFWSRSPSDAIPLKGGT